MTTATVQCERPASCELLTHDHPASDRAMTQDYQNPDWHCLADLQPAQRQLCEWKFVADSYTEQGVGAYYAGENASAFSNDKGGFVSDPTRTYWKAVKTSPEYQAAALKQEAIWQRIKPPQI